MSPLRRSDEPGFSGIAPGGKHCDELRNLRLATGTGRESPRSRELDSSDTSRSTCRDAVDRDLKAGTTLCHLLTRAALALTAQQRACRSASLGRYLALEGSTKAVETHGPGTCPILSCWQTLWEQATIHSALVSCKPQTTPDITINSQLFVPLPPSSRSATFILCKGTFGRRDSLTTATCSPFVPFGDRPEASNPLTGPQDISNHCGLLFPNDDIERP